MIRRAWAMVLLGVCITLAALGVTPSLAQESQPQAVTLFTRYPVQEISIGDTVTLPLTLRTSGAPQLVRLELQNIPEAWSASFRGDGKAVQAVYVDAQADTTVDLRIEPPGYVKPDTYRLTVLASGAAGDARLPIELIAKDKAPSGLALNVAQPSLKGAPNTTFRYEAKLEYGGDQDATINLQAEAPRGLQVDFLLAGQNVTSVPLTANDVKDVSIEIKPFPDLAAGVYQVKVDAQGAELQAATDLTVEVTGQATLALAGPDGRLSGEAQIGATTPFKLIVQNTGSAPARNVELSSSPPAGWTVTFEPAQIPEIANGQSVEVTANVKPADQAIAGDYQINFTARPQDSPSGTADFRITLLTSTLWGLVGVILIAVAVAVIGGAVFRFGRR